MLDIVMIRELELKRMNIRHLFIIKKSAKMRDARKIFNVEYYYQKEIGVEKNVYKAFTYYQKLAEIGYASGTLALADCYKNGIGVKKDEHKAFIYYKESAKMGNANGTYNVGYCYDNSIGVGKNE